MKKTKVTPIKTKSKKIVFPTPFKLDVACGQNKTPDFFGVDIAAEPGVDLVHDLENFPWPIPDNSVDEIVCNHYIEHTKDLIKFMNEIYRIMKPGAKANYTNTTNSRAKS
jgi:predicted SAM-dependent methyltransferase